ncbi:hypothetical protein LPW26_16080 [Rhodopseudomonas sp. HC1]|uniref:hypothetical protein n=1 Tax=Rhodopseudomonas infernalis TaxID=2897386 RepID=UPI001EE92979|nr:hypothetical protein [Rhodopseudomonas infernalis]MCG6206169.1 hypothetical protein [Rhodopseudomonas infernalis]
MSVAITVAIICLINVALVAWQAHIDQINNDGILYVRAARLFASGDWDGARQLFFWFAYPLLVGSTMAATSVDAWPLALFLNGAASTLTVLLILRCAWIVRPQRATLIAAALLLFGNLWFNDLRATIVREHFYFLFMIAGFYCALRDLQSPRMAYKFGFAGLTLVAAAFRIEALGFLVLVPTLRIVFESTSRPMRWAAIALLILAPLAALAAIAGWSNSGSLQNLLAAPAARIEILRSEVLFPFESRKASYAYVAMVGGLLLYGLVTAIGVATILLVGFAARADGTVRRSSGLRLAGVYLLSGIVIYATQVYFNLVFDPRHGLILSLIFTPFAAVGLADLYRATKSQRRIWTRVLAGLIAALLLAGFAVGMRKSDSQSYRMTAGAWLASHLPKTARIASNSNQILFYGGFANTTPDLVVGLGPQRPNPAIFDRWSDYDAVVLELRQSQTGLAQELQSRFGQSPVETLTNSRGDEILIYRR